MGRFNLSDMAANTKHAFTTREGFLHMIRTKETEGMTQNKENGELLLSNVDLDPTPVADRNWTAWYVSCFQQADEEFC